MNSHRISGRRQSIARAEYRRQALSTTMGQISRTHLLVLATDLPKAGLVNSTEAFLLAKLISTVPAAQYESGGIPIVFKSNRTLAFEIGKSANHVSALLSRLCDKGLITMQDSANYKRFAQRGKAGVAVAAFGIDLRILMARHGELSAMVESAKLERSRHEAAWVGFRGALRQFFIVFASAEDHNDSQAHCRWARRFASIASRIDRRTKAGVLDKAARLCVRLTDALLGVQGEGRTEGVTDKIVSTGPDKREHILITDLYQSHSCSAGLRRSGGAEHNVRDGEGTSLRALEKQGQAEGALVDVGSGRRAEPDIGTVVLACPALKSWLGVAPGNWPALTEKYPLLCALLGISPDARDRAYAALGSRAAAMAIALILERQARGEIKSPGGFLRALVHRRSSGELHLSRSIYARAQQRLEPDRLAPL